MVCSAKVIGSLPIAAPCMAETFLNLSMTRGDRNCAWPAQRAGLRCMALVWLRASSTRIQLTWQVDRCNRLMDITHEMTCSYMFIADVSLKIRHPNSIVEICWNHPTLRQRRAKILSFFQNVSDSQCDVPGIAEPTTPMSISVGNSVSGVINTSAWELAAKRFKKATATLLLQLRIIWSS